MFTKMSPELAKTLAVGLVCLFVGSGLGFYGASRLEGPASSLSVDPGVKTACPKCEACPVCPAAPDCGELGVVPTAEDTDDLPDVDDDVNDVMDIDPNALPGLPPSALKLASDAVIQQIDGCLRQAAGDGERGIVVLALTVTATGGVGFVSDATAATHDGDVTGALECGPRDAQRAKFEWNGSDGRQELRLPIQVGDAQ